MEKQRINRTSGFIKRLLVLFFLLYFFPLNLFAARTSSKKIDFLEFKTTENQKLFINTDIQFEVKIQNILPTEIQIIQDNRKQKNVNFQSMKKFENYEEGGTKIQIWYNFEEAGVYELSPLKILINGKETLLNFPAVEIEEDPAKMPPRVVIIFSNGVKVKSDDVLNEKPIFNAYVGQKITFTVYLQYINQLVHLSFDIPKNSIYKQLKTYEITEVKYREKLFSNDLIPVADFEWTGLIEGKQPIPKFKLTAIDYAGYRTELMLPEFSVNFIPNKHENIINHDNELFEDAFAMPFMEINEPKKIKISETDCLQLAELYKKERNAIIYGEKYKKQRIALEENLGLPTTKNPFTFNLGILLLCIFVISAFSILLFFAIRKKNIFKIFVFSILLFSSSVFLIFVLQKRNMNYGISKGCTVYSIPEKNAETSSEIAPGNLIKITETTGNWLHVQLGETSGWCNTENIISIVDRENP